VGDGLLFLSDKENIMMRYRIMTVFLIAVITATGLQVSPASAASNYYVAPTGDDSNPGTEAQPFRTINKGISVLTPGDTLYLRKGIYHERVAIYGSGREGQPITILAYPNENVVIDGQFSLPTSWNYLLTLRGNYIVVRGLEVKNSAYCGVGVIGDHNEVYDLNVHHSKEQGILVTGDYNLVEGCEIWWNACDNEYGNRTLPYWATGLSAARHPNYTILRNNVVYNNWGEGLSTFEANHTLMEDNIVYDNWLNVYISDAAHVFFRRNVVYSTPGNPCERSAQIGIALGDEKYNPPSSDITIVNNLAFGNARNFYWWPGARGGGAKTILVAHNTFVNSMQETNFKFLDGDHENTRIENNIILQEDSLPIALVVSHPGLHFSHNLWSRIPPSSASSPDDVIGNPRLAKTGSIGPGLLTPEWFKLLASSPARDRARVIAKVTEDFFRNARGDSPDIGAHEYVEPPQSPTPTNTPTPTATSTLLPPTHTPTNTPTDTPTATNTPLPTGTPTRKAVQVFLPLIIKGWVQGD
jgi:hypothetical protein